jgi:sulfite exporter TauE/SafE
MGLDALSWNVLFAAAAVALVHAALGPDHYLPFAMLARARRWSLRRTLAVTAACGTGHVLSSLALGLGGAALGAALGVVEGIEAWRGTIAAWALLGFGLAYALWGVRRALRSKAGLELHRHGGVVHLHAHGDGAHQHADEVRSTTTFWALFVVFVLGPCEPLIPLFFLPASRGDWALAAATASVFSAVTIASMLALVALAHAGFERLALRRLERWSHALAGGVIAASGFAVLALGL